jgi:hypothetical protein
MRKPKLPDPMLTSAKERAYQAREQALYSVPGMSVFIDRWLSEALLWAEHRPAPVAAAMFTRVAIAQHLIICDRIGELGSLPQRNQCVGNILCKSGFGAAHHCALPVGSGCGLGSRLLCSALTGIAEPFGDAVGNLFAESLPQLTEPISMATSTMRRDRVPG